MAEKRYVPDQDDKDWLNGGGYGANGLEAAPILNPHHPKYKARMEWRRAQMEKKKQTEQYITKDQVKVWLIALAIILGFIFILYKAGQQPDAYTTPDCPGGNEYCN